MKYLLINLLLVLQEIMTCTNTINSTINFIPSASLTTYKRHSMPFRNISHTNNFMDVTSIFSATRSTFDSLVPRITKNLKTDKRFDILSQRRIRKDVMYHGAGRRYYKWLKQSTPESVTEKDEHNYRSILQQRMFNLMDEKLCFSEPSAIKYPNIEFDDMLMSFWPYDKIKKYLEFLEESYPERVTLKRLGKTYEGREVYVVHIGLGVEGNHVIWVDAGMRARDWSSIVMALYIIRVLVECDGFENFGLIDWMVAPITNPDGYTYSRENPKAAHLEMWNKNRRPCVMVDPSSCREDLQGCGVDLVKNFPHSFALFGTSIHECSNFYAGDRATSEKETKGIIDHLYLFRRQIKLYIGLHSFGAFILYPYSGTNVTVSNLQELQYLAQVGAKAINGNKSIFSAPYTIGSYIDKISIGLLFCEVSKSKYNTYHKDAFVDTVNICKAPILKSCITVHYNFLIGKHLFTELSPENKIINYSLRFTLPVSGTSLDHVKSNLNFRYAYYIHLRGDYQMKRAEIAPVITEAFYGICTMAREVSKKYLPSKNVLRKIIGKRRRRRNASIMKQPTNSYLLFIVLNCCFTLILIM